MLLAPLLFLLVQCDRQMRFVALPADSQAIKSRSQIEKHYKAVQEVFNLKNRNAVQDNWNKDVFMYMDGREMVAFLQVENTVGYRNRRWYEVLSGEKVGVPYVSFYCMTVVEKYKGRGISARFLTDVVEYLKKTKRISSDAMLALHLSPSDRDMYIAARIYYKLGFTRGAFGNNGPMDYRNDIDRFVTLAKDLYEVADDPSIANAADRYIVLYCPLKDFGTRHNPPKDAIQKGKLLMRFLEEQRQRLLE